MKHPLLFASIENEARSQPILDDLLRKAGLLQHLRQRVAPAALTQSLPVGMNGGWNQGTGSHSLGQSPYIPHVVQGNGGLSGLGGGGAPANRVPVHQTGAYLPGHAAPPHVQQGLPSGQMQYVSHMHPTQTLISSQASQQTSYANSTISPRLSQIGHVQGQASISAHSVQVTGASMVPSAVNAQNRYLDVSSR